MHLVLNTFGTALQTENGLFLVIHQEGKQSIAVAKLKSITIGRGVKLTSDALMLAIQSDIDVLFVNKSGQPAGRLWGNRFGSISTIRRHQVGFATSQQGVDWIKGVIVRKADNQMALLMTLGTDAGDINKASRTKHAIARMEPYKGKITAVAAASISEVAPSLRGWEGQFSQIYFRCISQALPLPYQFERRSQHPALDMFNCLLNYAYGMLYGKVESALIKAGIDPYIGVLHRDEYNRTTMVYDVIEVFRVWVDYVVINLCMQEVVLPDFFEIRKEAYWLEGYGKRILIQSVNDYMEEIISWDGLSRTRQTHIDLYAQRLAQQLLHFQNKEHSSTTTDAPDPSGADEAASS